jgi:hypothetical protein
MEDGNTLREALEDLGLSQTGLARLMIELGDDRDEKNIVRSIQRMIAGDARVSGEMRALLGFVKRDPKPFVFNLDVQEANEIRNAVGSGGHQSLHRRLVAELDRPPGNQVTFTDEQMGELIRYMTRYGSGGFQGRLRHAFARVFLDLFTPVLQAERRT